MNILFLFALVVLSIVVSVNFINDANALSQNDCIALTNKGTMELGYTVVTCDNPFNVTVNMGQRLHIQNPTGGSHNMLPSASYGNPGTYQFSSTSTGVVGTSGTIKLQNPPDIGISLQNVQVSFSGSQMSVSGNIVNSNNFPVKDLYVYWHVTDSSGNYLTSWTRYGGNDGQAYSAQISAQSTGTFSETVCCVPSSGASTATPYIVQAFRDDGTKLISINNPPIIIVNSPSDNPNSTIEGNNLELKIIVTGTVQNKILGKDSISVTFTDPKGIIVYQKSLTLNSQGSFNNEFENPLYIKDMRDSGLYHAKFVYDTITKEFDWNYLTSVYTSPVLDTIPPVVVVPNNMAIQATGNNPSPVTFSVSATDDKDGPMTPTCSPKPGSTFPIGKTTVTCTATDKAGNTATKSFTVTITNVSAIDTDGDGIPDSLDSCPTKDETVNGYTDTDGCPDAVPIPSSNSNEITITPALGSGAPGCEKTSQGCYLPKSASVNVGGKVIFKNTDTAAHTFTAGTAAEGPSGEFDTSLVIAGSQYEWTPTTVGEFPYHCMVHPWMEGTITIVNSNINNNTTKTVTLPVMVDDKKFSVTSKTTGVSITKISADPDFVSLILDVITIGNPGILEITFERSFFDSIYQGEDDNFIVLADGDEPKYYEIKTTSQSRTLSIELRNGIEKVEIIGSQFAGIPAIIAEPVVDESATGMLSDGTKVSITASGEKMEIAVEFENSEHVNYDIMARQNGVILNDVDVHSHDGERVHETAPLSSDPVEVTITFQGYGVDEPKTGPIGEQIVLNIIPEFGSSDTVNDIPPTTGDLPYEITITPALGSGAPGCEETSQGCYIPKVASVANGGKVIFKNTDTAAHTFTAGTAAEGPSGEFDTSLVIAGSSFAWMPTAEGQYDYYCMVHPWMAGLILVGEGTYIPPTEDDFDLQIIMGNQVYDLLDTATMNLFLDGVTNPQNVALEMSGPSGTTVISRSFLVDSQGTSFEFRIDENFKTGTYTVVATTSDNGNTVSDTAYFKVKSQYNSFKITSVQVTDQQGNPSNLEIGEIGFIKVNLEANKAITTLVTVNLFDSDLTSIGIGSIKTTLSSGNSEIILSFMIPDDASIGPANIYVNAFSDWPSNGGIPLTGEISVVENIE